jgi:hypothetical protein
LATALCSTPHWPVLNTKKTNQNSLLFLNVFLFDDKTSSIATSRSCCSYAFSILAIDGSTNQQRRPQSRGRRDQTRQAEAAHGHITVHIQEQRRQGIGCSAPPPIPPQTALMPRARACRHATTAGGTRRARSRSCSRRQPWPGARTSKPRQGRTSAAAEHFLSRPAAALSESYSYVRPWRQRSRAGGTGRRRRGSGRRCPARARGAWGRSGSTS